MKTRIGRTMISMICMLMVAGILTVAECTEEGKTAEEEEEGTIQDALVPRGKVSPYRSKELRYVKVVLSEDGSKILPVVFDESKGTGKGYDLLYADVGALLGKAKQPKRLRAKPEYHTHRDKGNRTYKHLLCHFPPINLSVPYSEKAGGVWNPPSVVFEYNKYFKEDGGEYFSVKADIEWKENLNLWQYYFRGSMKPSDTLENAPLWSFNHPPEIKIHAFPDDQKKGYLEIHLSLKCGSISVECRKKKILAKIDVKIKNSRGRVIHKHTINKRKKSIFERERREDWYCYSANIPKGNYIVEASMNTGPLAGLVEGSKQVSFK